MWKKEKVFKVEGLVGKEIEDKIALESLISIKTSEGEILASITPDLIKEFVYGHLFAEGYITSLRDIKEVEIKEAKELIIAKVEGDIKEVQKKGRIIWSSCGVPPTPFLDLKDRVSLKKIQSDKRISLTKLRELMQTMSKSAHTHWETGGTHICGAADEDELVFAEDIGRHNAIDKVTGILLLNEKSFDKVLLISGRITVDTVTKAIRCGFPIIASKSAALSAAVEMARKYGITLVGFMRGEKLNVYTHPKRILLQ